MTSETQDRQSYCQPSPALRVCELEGPEYSFSGRSPSGLMTAHCWVAWLLEHFPSLELMPVFTLHTDRACLTIWHVHKHLSRNPSNVCLVQPDMRMAVWRGNCMGQEEAQSERDRQGTGQNWLTQWLPSALSRTSAVSAGLYLLPHRRGGAAC